MAKSWEEFKKRFHADVFFGVVTAEGEWVDSAIQFLTAAHFAAMHEGYHGQTAIESIAILDKLTNSVVHSSMLKQMYEAGLLK